MPDQETLPEYKNYRFDITKLERTDGDLWECTCLIYTMQAGSKPIHEMTVNFAATTFDLACSMVERQCQDWINNYQ